MDIFIKYGKCKYMLVVKFEYSFLWVYEMMCVCGEFEVVK